MAGWLSAVVSVILRRLKDRQEHQDDSTKGGFPDLSELPPELSLSVLSHLNATDLCLAACVWRELAHDELLWHSLCRSQWSYMPAYYGSFLGKEPASGENPLKKSPSHHASYHPHHHPGHHASYNAAMPHNNNQNKHYHKNNNKSLSYQRLYLLLDEGTVTFNADPFLGMEYFLSHNLVANSSFEIAKFLHHTRAPLNRTQMRRYLNERRDVLEHLISLHNFRDESLPGALRKLFQSIQAPNEMDTYLHTMLDKFSQRFCKCNPQLGLGAEMVYLLCFSLIMLSVDLSSPHVKNKMSKREFIRNVRHAIRRTRRADDDDYFGHLYDDVYLQGHIAPYAAE